jgi:pimeloyl-ACP methyl ester carboxylesterase
MRYLAGAMVHGARGVLEDERLLALPWGFSPAEVAPGVRWWHGDADATVPFASVRGLLEELSEVQLVVLAGAGHLLWPDHGPAILGAL